MPDRHLPIRALSVLLLATCVIASVGCPPKEDTTAIAPDRPTHDPQNDTSNDPGQTPIQDPPLTAEQGTDGQQGTESQGTEGQGTETQGTAQGTEGQGTEGQATEGQGTEGQGTERQGIAGQGPPLEFNEPANDRTADDATGAETGAGNAADTAAGDATSGTTQQAIDQEPLFVDWPDPEFALFITGRQNGYIEPCGCTGLANQKGGLMRRHSLYKQLVARGYNLVPIDLGNQIRRFGMQPVIKFTRTFEVMAQLLDYQAIGFGPDDLRMDSIELLQTVENYKNDITPFVSCNVNVLDLFETHRVVESGERRIGITSVFADRLQLEVKNSDVEFKSAADGLTATMEELAQENCDLLVLLAFASVEECEAIARSHPGFDVIVSAGGDGEPTRQPDVIEVNGHKTYLVQSGYKGMHVGVIGFFPDGEQRLRYQRIPLDGRYEDSEEVQVVFKAYQEQLKTLGLNSLGLEPVSHPSGLKYVGSDVCADCHTKAYDIWRNGVDGKGGPHAHATLSLTDPGERTWVQRHHDPECLSCHVTGWNPQKFFPYESGYLDLEASAHLVANGCENCHGPGSAHVDAEEGNDDVDDDEMIRRQLQMRVTLEEAKKNTCLECHDLDNSPDFHLEGAWEKYWSQVEHYGKS